MSFNTFVEQQFAMEPQDQVAVVGARVILPCRVINKQGVLQWTKDDFGLGTRRKLVGFDRYQMIGLSLFLKMYFPTLRNYYNFSIILS